MNTGTITHKEGDASESNPSQAQCQCQRQRLWQLAIKGTPAFGHSLRSAPEREARGPLGSTVCRYGCPSQIQVLRGGPPRDRWEKQLPPSTSHRPRDSILPTIVTVHSISTFTLGGQRPGDAPTPRLPNHCPVKGPELNYLGTPSSRLSRRDNVESLQRDCPDIISHMLRDRNDHPGSPPACEARQSVTPSCRGGLTFDLI